MHSVRQETCYCKYIASKSKPGFMNSVDIVDCSSDDTTFEYHKRFARICRKITPSEISYNIGIK